MMVLVGRPEGDEWLRRFPAATTVRLGPMPRTDAMALANALVPDRPLGVEAGATLATAAGGNPLFLRELVHHGEPTRDSCGRGDGYRLAGKLTLPPSCTPSWRPASTRCPPTRRRCCNTSRWWATTPPNRRWKRSASPMPTPRCGRSWRPGCCGTARATPTAWPTRCWVRWPTERCPATSAAPCTGGRRSSPRRRRTALVISRSP